MILNFQLNATGKHDVISPDISEKIITMTHKVYVQAEFQYCEYTLISNIFCDHSEIIINLSLGISY